MQALAIRFLHRTGTRLSLFSKAASITLENTIDKGGTTEDASGCPAPSVKYRTRWRIPCGTHHELPVPATLGDESVASRRGAAEIERCEGDAVDRSRAVFWRDVGGGWECWPGWA